ncbi:MAG: DUF2339 domain-containing protein [Hyphomicrobiaceae bacterium]
MIFLLLLAIIVLAGLALAQIGRLSSKVERLSKRLGDVERHVAAGRALPREEPAAASPVPTAADGREPVVEPPAATTMPSDADVIAAAEAAAPSVTMPGTPSPPPSAYGGVEQALGTKWAVWLGGIALALGGIFLVRYSIEAGLIGPRVRIWLGALLALGLAIAGEWSRRREVKLGVAIPSAYIPGVLTAAAIVVAFATIYAAHALYGFLGPTAAFLLLGATGLVAMLGALRHGPALAALGLAASYLTPALVTSQSPSYWPLVLFLAVVAAAAYMLARARRWLWLAAIGVAGAFLWGVLLLSATAAPETQWPFVTHILAQLALAAIFMAVEPHLGVEDGEARPDWIASGALAALTLLLVMGLLALPTAFGGWLPLASLAMIGLAAAAWKSAPAVAAILLAGFIALAVALLWTGVEIGPDQSRLLPGVRETFRLPSGISAYLAYLAMAALGVAAAAGLRLWIGRRLPLELAAGYAAAATTTPLLAMVIAYLRVTQFDSSVPFAAAGISLAAIFTLATDRFQRTETGTEDSARLTTGAFAAATIAALSFALFALLERGYLTVAFALAALGAAYVASVRDIPLLRYAVATLGGIVLIRVIYDPRIMGVSVGSWPIINWLLLGYGVPALAFWQSARLLRPRFEDLAVRLADGLTVLFAALLVFFEIRHLLNAGDPLATTFDHVEVGLHVIAGLGLSLTLTRLDLVRANPVFRWGSEILAGIAVLFALVGLGLLANPLLLGDPVTGPPVLSSLLPGYLLPGLMALLVARQGRGRQPAWQTVVVTSLGLVLILGYVTLSVRHAFQGDTISIWLETSDAEHWAHSVAWLALGVVLLLYGLWRGAIEARLASGLLVTLAAVKIAVFDLSGLTGLWQALSFLCLGAVLIGIGVLYQRLIFGGRGKGSAAARN